MRKQWKRIAIVLTFCLLIGGMLVPNQITRASEGNDNILNVRKGILQVAISVKAKDKLIGRVNVGTGFLVGDENGAKTVITNYHVAHAVETSEAWIRKQLGLTPEDKVKFYPSVVVKRDVYIDAKIVNESLEADFAILELEQPIYDRAPLKLADSDQVQTTGTVYALGFPGIVQDRQNDQVYVTDDVTVTTGIVSKTSDVVFSASPIPCITHSATIAGGNSGGPLVNEDGAVIGVNRESDMEVKDNGMGDKLGGSQYFYSIKINEIRDVLDALGIAYAKADNVEPETENVSEPATEAMAEPIQTEAAPETENAYRSELRNQLRKADQADLEYMTDESIENFREAKDAAEAVYGQTTASDPELKSALEELRTAQEGLVKEEGISTLTIVFIAIGTAAVIALIVAVILLVRASKKKRAAENEKAKKTQFQQRYQSGFGNTEGFQQPDTRQKNAFEEDGSAETGILNDGAMETTVLAQNMPTAYLMRTKNAEGIQITKPIFKIGKERNKTDYCVSDNTNVSRTHADILYRDGEFYLVDRNSTNGTSLNGRILTPGREEKLTNQDMIKMADEEFKFKTY